MTHSPQLEKSFTIPEMPIWRLSVEQYHEMIRTGILTADDQIELLEGLLVTKMTKNPPHSLATQLLRDILSKHLPTSYFVSDQEPFTTTDSEPEPDLMIVRGQRRDFATHHPSPEQIALVIEVSDSTLLRDRTAKLRIYANVKIPAYWILNLPERQLEAYAQPNSNGSYQQNKVYTETDKIALELDGKQINEILIQDILT